MAQLTYGSLFSGIGGMDLGLDRAGFHCEWQVEIDEYAQKVLAKHWPNVTRFRDVRDCGKHNLIPVDLICGGFPCQDISQSNNANSQGISGSRSGLWTEFYRIVCELRPRYVLVENVAALLYRGIDIVLRDLAESGYDAEWQMLRACDFGLPHKRERVFIVAYPHEGRRDSVFAHHPQVSYGLCTSKKKAMGPDTVVSLRALVAQLEESWGTSSVCRKDDGLPYWLDRLGVIGNAVVPQVAEYLGRCIMKAHERRK